MELWILIGVVALAGCDSRPTNQKTATSNTVVLAPLDYLAAQGRAKQHATKVISTAQLESAIQQFQAMEDRLPASFEELVKQRYLAALPEAPRGRRFTYDPQTGRVALIPE